MLIEVEGLPTVNGTIDGEGDLVLCKTGGCEQRTNIHQLIHCSVLITMDVI